jgi:hypothetical protein
LANNRRNRLVSQAAARALEAPQDTNLSEAKQTPHE